MRRTTSGRVSVVAAGALLTAVGVRLLVGHDAGDIGLVTNEYAHWNDSADAVEDDTWDVTSGSLFRLEDGVLWTGEPDAETPDPTSTRATGSTVFRALHGDRLAGDVHVRLTFRIDALVETRDTPRRDWDGLHVFLRYASESRLYYVSVARRDGHLAIKKKVPGGPSNGGTYYTLADVAGHPGVSDGWHHAELHLRDVPGGAVELSLSLDGRMVIEAVDDGVGGPVIDAGRVGLRGDNAEIRVRGFDARPDS